MFTFIKNALQLHLRIPIHVRYRPVLFIRIFLYQEGLFETAKSDGSQLPQKH